jgi:ATP-dependent DNA helicase 2 subunit 1
VVKAFEEFKTSVYGENYDEESEHGTGKPTEASKKRKAHTEYAMKECENYDWGELADTGKVNLEIYFVLQLNAKLLILNRLILFCS